MRLKQKVLSMLVCLMMCFTLMPSVALAGTTEYDVWVGGIRITSENMEDVLGNGGKVSYVPATDTNPAELRLNGANIYAKNVSLQFKENAAIYARESLNIVLAEGSVNSIQSNISNDNRYGIYLENIYNKLTITGKGTLNVETKGDCDVSIAIRVPRSDMSIEDGAIVNATSGVAVQSYAVQVTNGNLIVSNGAKLVANSMGLKGDTGLSRGISLSSDKSVQIGIEGSLESRAYSQAIYAKEVTNMPGSISRIQSYSDYEARVTATLNLSKNLCIKVSPRTPVNSVAITCDSKAEYGEYVTDPVCEFESDPTEAARISCNWVKLDETGEDNWVSVPNNSKFTPGSYKMRVDVSSKYPCVFAFDGDGSGFVTDFTFNGKDVDLENKANDSVRFYSDVFVIEDRTAYGVTINGKEFTSLNNEDGIPCGEGKATLDVSTTPYTLTLDNATISSDDAEGIYSEEQSLKIVLIGDNSIVGENNGLSCYGNSDVIITGSGNLTVNAAAMYRGAMYATNIVFENEGNITIVDECSDSHSGAITASNDVTFAGSGDVNVSSLYMPAVYVKNVCTFDGLGEVRLKGSSDIYHCGAIESYYNSILLNGKNKRIVLETVDGTGEVTNNTVAGSNIDNYKVEGSVDSGLAIFTYVCSHSNKEIRNYVAPTCTKKGYSGDTYCVDCNLKIEAGKATDALGHKYGDYVVTKNPTDKVTGSKERICSVCGNKETAVIPTVAPTNVPTSTPTAKPTATPTKAPATTVAPTTAPVAKPTTVPTAKPTKTPDTTVAPEAKPTDKPVIKPTAEPTKAPATSVAPEATPTTAPSGNTTTTPPEAKPTTKPTAEPTKAPSVEDFAERLYTTCLGREAEEAGKDYWVSELKAGKPGSEVAEGFFFSPEYENRKLDNKDFIGTLYETFMGRTPADEEVAYWSSEMDNGKARKDIFDGFVNSPEWANICLTYGIRSGGLAAPTFEKEASDAVKAFAERLYTTCLGREAEKESLEWWAAELANLRQTGTVAASGFFYSPEFIGLKTSDDEYVTRLYRTFMGREPEEAGFEFWTSELKAGKDRQYVFDGFSVAPEFANLCAEAGIMR